MAKDNDKLKEKKAQDNGELPLESVIENATSIEELEELEPKINNEEDDKEDEDGDKKPDKEDEDDDDKADDKKDEDEDDKANDKEDEDDDDKDDKEDKVEKTIVTDDLRKQFNIPEKFKYVEDFSKWGHEAEKAKTLAETSRAESLREKADLEKKIAYFQGLNDKNAKDEGMTDDEKAAVNEKLREDMENDPAGTIAKIFDKQEQKRIEKENVMRIENEKKDKFLAYKQEETALIDKVGKDDYEYKIKPRLIEIAKAREEKNVKLESISDAYAIYVYEESQKKQATDKEHKEKKEKKKKVFTETPNNKRMDEPNLIDKMNGAKTIEELEALEKEME